MIAKLRMLFNKRTVLYDIYKWNSDGVLVNVMRRASSGLAKRVYMMLIRADFSTPETVKVTGEIDYVKMLHF